MAFIDTIISGETRKKSYPHCTIVCKAGPIVEPVTLEEVKKALRIRITDHDSLISKLLKASRILIEKATGMSFIEAEFEQHQDFTNSKSAGAVEWTGLRPVQTPTIKLYRRPILSVTNVSYIPNWSSDVPVVFESTNYVAALHRQEIRLREGASWPEHREYQSLITTFKCGYYHMLDSSAEETLKAQQAVPENYKIAIAEYAGYLYSDPEGIAEEIYGKEGIPKQVLQLIDSDRWRL